MIKNKKLFIIPGIVISSVVVLASAISCQGNSKEYSVTLHAGTGHTVNKQKDYSYKVNNKIDLEPTPDTKYGSSFIGWYDNEELKGSTVTFPLTVNKDIELYASYNNMSGVHAVTFDSNGGSEVPTYYINNEERIESKPITSKDGYRFNDWLDPKGNVVTFPYTPTQDIELTAYWTKLDEKGGTLVLNTNGGTAPEGFKEGESYVFSKEDVETVVTAPTTTKDSFNLEGWYTTSTFEEGTRVSFDTPISILKGETVTWYAHWVGEPISSVFTVTLNDASQTSRELKTSKLNYEPEATKKDHYKCTSNDTWYLDKECKTTPVTYPYTVTDDVNFYAKYVPITECVITLKDADGSSLYTVTKDAETQINSPFDYTGTIYPLYGNFLGWSTDGTKSNIITYPYTIPTQETLTLTAVFDITSANVNIYNSEPNCESEEVQYDLIKSLGNIKTLIDKPSVVIADRVNDYTLNCLCTKPTTTEAEAITISYPFNVSSLKGLITDDHELKLYAIWDVDTRVYNVKLDYGTHPEFSAINITYDRGDEVDPDTFTKHLVVDEEITGWKDKATGKPVTEKFNITSEKTFVAQWTVTHRTLEVYKKDGETLRDTYNHMPVKLKLSDVPQSTESCYELTGYKVNGEIKSLDTIIYLKDNPTKIIEVFGKQVATKLTIQYNNGTTVTGIDDKVIDEQPLSFKVNTLPIATHQTYVISKFKYNNVEYELNDTNTIDIDTSLPKEEQKIYAIWTRDKYDVSFVDNDDGTTVLSTLKNVNVLTSDNIPVPTKTGKRFTGYSKTKDGDIESLVGTKITAEGTKFYAHWEDSTTEFTVKFNLGSLQSGATFVKTKTATVVGRTATITTSNALAYDDCPTASCTGCSFLGWYASEYESSAPVYPLTSSQTLYARFAPLSDYVTVSLNISGDGTFDGIGSSTTLLTVKKTTTEVTGDTWGDVKSKVPNATFTDAFKISSWKDEDGNALTDETTFSDDTFVYSVDAEKVDTASDFENDSWPTFCSIADQGLTALINTYSTEYARENSETGKVKNSFVGSTRTVKYNNKSFTVRVVGMQQDKDSNGKYYPLTFEFTKSVSLDVFASSNCSYGNSAVKTALNTNGYIYNGIQKSLINHIKTVSKSNYNSGSTETNSCQLFIPSCYEINFKGYDKASTSFSLDYTGSFCYTYYSNASSTGESTLRVKNYSGIGPCCYWCRDNNGGTYIIEYDGDGSDNGATSRVDVYRGIAPMFCVGLAETK